MRPSIRAAALVVLLSGVSAQGGYCQPKCAFTHYSISNGLSEDGFGYLWIGSKGSGLFRLGSVDRGSPGRCRITGYRYDKTDPFSLSHDNVYSVFEDSSGKIWVGTFNGGLNYMEENS
jgi:hypothetical protein